MCGNNDLHPLSVVLLSLSFSLSSLTAIEAVISHPDEMENLEQYRVLDNYDRKDSHQVNLHAGQIVHVIEKHDTGVCVCVCVCACICLELVQIHNL